MSEPTDGIILRDLNGKKIYRTFDKGETFEYIGEEEEVSGG